MLLIFSCGRSGTNLCLEMFTDHWDYTPSVYPEDKLLFSKSACPESYLTKSDSVYCKSPEQFVTFMEQVPHCKVLWTARRVEDWAMSKIYRGWGRSDDATFEGCLEDFYHMFSIYKKAIELFPDRIFGEDMDLLRIMLLGNYIYEYALENYVPNMAKFKEIYSPVEIDL